MANARLKTVLVFIDVAPGATVSLPHNLNRNGRALTPDYCVSDNAAIEVQGAPATDEFNVTVTNTAATPQTARVLCEFWHSENRAQGVGLPGADSGDPIEPSPPFIPGSAATIINADQSNCFIYAPGSGLAGPTVFDDWNDLMAELAVARLANNGGGCYLIGFDDSFVSPALIPAGGPYDMSGVTWTQARADRNAVSVDIGDGAAFTNLRKIFGELSITSLAVAPSPSPVSDFSSANRMTLDRCSLAAQPGVPFFDLAPMGPGFVLFYMRELANFGLIGNPVAAVADGQTIAFVLQSGAGLQSDTVVGTAAASMFWNATPGCILGEQSGTFLGSITETVNNNGPYGNVRPVPPAAAAVAPFNATPNDNVMRFDVSGGGFTQVLPTLPEDSGFKLTARAYTVKEESGNAGLLVAPAAGNTIEGAAASVAVPPGGSVTFLPDNLSNWIIESVSDGTAVPTAEDTTTLFWGNDSTGGAADTRFISPGHDAGVAIALDVMQIPIARAGTLRNLFVRHNSAGGNGNLIDYELMINGAPTGITVSLATGAVVQASDPVNVAAVAPGDRISLRAVAAVAVGGGAIDVQASAEIAY